MVAIQAKGLFNILHVVIKAESIRKLRNFNFQWTKTLHQNNFNYLASFFTLFEGYMVIGNNSKEKVLMGTGKKQLQKLQIPQNKILLMSILPVFSQLPLIFFPQAPSGPSLWNYFR